MSSHEHLVRDLGLPVDPEPVIFKPTLVSLAFRDRTGAFIIDVPYSVGPHGPERARVTEDWLMKKARELGIPLGSTFSIG